MGFEAYEEHAPTCTAPYLPPRPAGPGSVEGTPYLYNHLRFVVKFHKEDSFIGARVVGFEVEPLSVKHQYKGKFTTDMSNLNLLTVPVGPDLPPQPVAGKKEAAAQAEVVYTYDVKWEYSEIKRAPVSGGGLQPAASAACGLCSLWPAACSSPWPPLPGPDSYPHPAPPRRPPCPS